MSRPLFSGENPMTPPLNRTFENLRKSYDTPPQAFLTPPLPHWIMCSCSHYLPNVSSKQKNIFHLKKNQIWGTPPPLMTHSSANIEVRNTGVLPFLFLSQFLWKISGYSSLRTQNWRSYEKKIDGLMLPQRIKLPLAIKIYRGWCLLHGGAQRL